MANALSDLIVGYTEVPSHAHTYLWADYVELLCVISQDKSYSIGQHDDLSGEFEDVRVDLDLESANGNLSFDDKISIKWTDISKVLKIREKQIPDFWPFSFEDGFLELELERGNKSHYLYLFLLVCSALKYCAGRRRNDVTGAFEELGFLALKRILPGWEVRPFGAHQQTGLGYVGSLGDKMHSLAEDINPRYVAPLSDFDPQDTGDGGLDVVAFMPLGDALGHIPVVFAQCGCSPKDWDKKQLEASPASMNSMITPQHPAANFYFMPHDMRNINGKWNKGVRIGDVILIDRKRILKLLSGIIDDIDIPEASRIAEEVSNMQVSYFE
jgi:hypothetical protein